MMSRSGFKDFCLLVSMIFIVQACATPPPILGVYMTPPVPSANIQLDRADGVRVIGVVKKGNLSGGFGLYGPNVDKSKAAALGAAEGAGAAFQGAAELSSGFGAGAAGMMVALPYLLPFFLVAGAIEGSMKGISSEKINALKTSAEEVLGYVAVQERLTGVVLEKGGKLKDFKFIAMDNPCLPNRECSDVSRGTLGLDAILDIQVYLVGLAKTAEKKKLRFTMEGLSRLVNPSNGEVIRIRPFSVRGPYRHVKEWYAGGVDLVAGEYERWMTALAETILEVMILQADLPAVVADHYCWLEPIEPPIKVGIIPPYATLVSLNPIMKWSSPFPAETGPGLLDDNNPAEISDVEYDLRIWKPVKGNLDQPPNSPGLLVYERTGLIERVHIVSETLEDGIKYFWSVRARFKKNGIEQRTGWASRNSTNNFIYRQPIGWVFGSSKYKEKALHPEWYMTWQENIDRSLGAKSFARCTSGYIEMNKYFRFKTKATKKKEPIKAPVSKTVGGK